MSPAGLFVSQKEKKIRCFYNVRPELYLRNGERNIELFIAEKNKAKLGFIIRVLPTVELALVGYEKHLNRGFESHALVAPAKMRSIPETDGRSFHCRE